MTCEQNCLTSAGNGQLVLTTFRCADSKHLANTAEWCLRKHSLLCFLRLLAVLKGGTRTQCLLDLREPVMLEKFDQSQLFTSHPAITQRAIEDKQPGRCVWLVSGACLEHV